MAFLISCTSCLKEINSDEIYTSPKITLNAICTADSVFIVEVWGNKSIAGYMSDFVFLKNATVKLYTDGVETEKLVYKDKKDFNFDGSESIGREPFLPTSAFRSKTIVEEGKKYKLEVSHPDYKTVWSEINVPRATPIAKIDTTMTTFKPYEYEDSYSKKINVRMRIDDPIDETNYYRLIVSAVSGNYMSGMYYDSKGNAIPNDEYGYISVIRDYSNNNFQSTDPILTGNNDVNNLLFGDYDNYFSIFTDELFNGKSHTFSFTLSDYLAYNVSCSSDTQFGEFYRIYITLQSITESTYLYIKSLEAHKAFISGILSEPVQVYNNIENGIGIFGCVSSATAVIQNGEYPIESVKYIFEQYYY